MNMQTKKCIAFALVLAVCAAGAFAEISIGGGVDMVVVPFQAVTRDTAEHDGNVWVGAGIGRNGVNSGIRTRMMLSGNHNDTFGFRTDLWFLYTNNQTNLYPGSNHNAMEMRLGDHGHLWWRPLDWFRLDVGRVFNTSLSGRVHDHWHSLWSIAMFGGDNIFTSHYSGNIGLLAGFTPPQVEGLSVYLFVPSFGMPFDRNTHEFGWIPGSLLTPGGGGLNSIEDDNENRHRAWRVLQRSWITVGYQINDDMLARVQFVGANPSGSVNWTDSPYRYRVSLSAPRIEAAFAFSNDIFLVDVGARVWMPISDWITDIWSEGQGIGYIREVDTGTYWGGIGFGLGASITITEQLRVNFRADGDMLRRWSGTHMGLDTQVTNPVRLSFHLWPTFTLANGVSFLASVGANYVGRNTVDRDGTNPNDNEMFRTDWDRSNRLRLGGGLSMRVPLFGNSAIQFGLTYSHGTADIRGGEERVISVPISFFYHW